MKSNIEKWDEGVKKDGCVTHQQILDGDNDTSDNSEVLNILIVSVSFCPNCGCGNPKKTYDGYWCKMCKTEF